MRDVLRAQFVDVWHAELRGLDSKALTFWDALLSDQERQRSQEYKRPERRQGFVAVRGLLRCTLAGYLDVEPRELVFESGEYGKPALAGARLHFNISHSGDHLLIAVSDLGELGVDVESLRVGRNLHALAGRCFSVREYREWAALPTEQQLPTFYRLWVKKEAFVKAVGRGIAAGLDLCEFALEAGGQLVAIPGEFGGIDAWSVVELPVANAAAALVAPNKSGMFCFRELGLGV
ncbi:4'-phosphopantetheinyl transferase family protein [Methylomonas sp. HW2-6]|uniref:4'-phosphopantetheinyl transferase family protein n=1 Tax=Methylomonas sp. HW2-6 TaxID=3376687 RepID=UPI00404146BA